MDDDKIIIDVPQKRALALDALRGIAILLMVLSDREPFGVLPDWMYHAQVPPPLHKFIPTLPGITWADLVFPLFLFSMGAAIPLSLSRRIDEGISKKKILFGVFERGFFLLGFAIYDMHIRPDVMNLEPTVLTWLTALLGFALLFPALWKMPRNWNSKLKMIIRITGYAAVILFLSLVNYPETDSLGKGFSLFRSDIIILILANVTVTGSLIWLLTRSNLTLRLGFLGFLMAIRLSHFEPGWIKFLWDGLDLWWLNWIGTIDFQQYLFIVIPGTVVGDLIIKWMKSPAEKINPFENKNKLTLISALMFCLILVTLVGLKIRWVEITTVILFAMCGIGFFLLKNPVTEIEKFFKALFCWGAYWLILGLIFEPFEGGIKKDYPTMSYYFVTSGLAIFALIGFAIIIDVLKKKWLNLFVYNGQNPIIAYAGITNLLPPLIALTMADKLLLVVFPTPCLGVLRAILETLLLSYFVSIFTKKKIFLRA